MRRSQSSTSSDRKQKKREKALSSHHRVRRGRACDMAALRLVPGWTRTPMRKSGIRPISSRRPWSDGLASRGRRSGNGGNSCRASAEGSAETNPSVFLGSTPVLLFSAAEFGVLSLDLPTRNAVDEGVRDLVLAATDEETRATAREVSNVFPQAYLCLAALASAWLVFAASDGEGSRPYATRTREWASRGPPWASPGSRWTSRRTCSAASRPQLGLSSFAFPSGHTCAACVLSGVFFVPPARSPPRVEDVARRAGDRTRDRRREKNRPNDSGPQCRRGRSSAGVPLVPGHLGHGVRARRGEQALGVRHDGRRVDGDVFSLGGALGRRRRRGASGAEGEGAFHVTGFVLHRGSTASARHDAIGV